MRSGGTAAHHFNQLRDIGRCKKVQSDHGLGPPCRGGDLIEVEPGGIAGENSFGPCDAIQFGQQGGLDRHSLEHRFDDQITVVEDIASHRWA